MNNKFNEMTDNLLNRIPELDDYEILYGMYECVAILNDQTSSISVPRSEYFPIGLTAFYDGVYVRSVLEKDERALLCKLTAINGIGIDEIAERFRNVIPVGNEYYLWVDLSARIRRTDLLRYIGVIGSENVAEFTFTDLNGVIFTMEIEAMTVEGYEKEKKIAQYVDYEKYFMYSRQSEYYWYEYLPDDNMMYVRFRAFSEMEHPIDEFAKEIVKELQKVSGVEKFVFDMRGNTNNYMRIERFIALLNVFIDHEELLGKTYILIDSHTKGYGVMAAAIMKENLRNAVIIGEPAGNSPNGLEDPYPVYLPNSGVGFTVSWNYYNILPGYKHDALLPDIYIYRTFEEFVNNYDNVLETIRRY